MCSPALPRDPPRALPPGASIRTMRCLVAIISTTAAAAAATPTLHFFPSWDDGPGWHDVAGAITHLGIHHVFQGQGWNHASSNDLVRWRAAPHGPFAVHETYAGMNSTSDPCSGFLTKDPADSNRVCAGFRQCGSDAGVQGGNPWDVPLELRCALDDALSAFDDANIEYLFNVSFWRAIPHDPARRRRDVAARGRRRRVDAAKRTRPASRELRPAGTTPRGPGSAKTATGACYCRWTAATTRSSRRSRASTAARCTNGGAPRSAGRTPTGRTRARCFSRTRRCCPAASCTRSS